MIEMLCKNSDTIIGPKEHNVNVKHHFRTSEDRLRDDRRLVEGMAGMEGTESKGRHRRRRQESKPPIEKTTSPIKSFVLSLMSALF